jgi:D-alanyl-D-alanine carboxypeptidase
VTRSWLVAVLILAACAGPAATAPAAPDAKSAAAPTGPDAATMARGSVGVERLVARLPLARPDQPDLVADLRAALVADHCTDRDLAAPASTDVVLTVLDRTYALTPGYAPDDLVQASTAGLAGSSGTKLVRAVIVDDLAAMRSAWEAAGLVVTIESAYRSYAGQAATFRAWVARLGPAGALLRTARPGHSEHQLGTAIDVTSPGWAGRFGDWAAESAEGAWMAAHAWEHGFVMSYSSGGQAETCFGYEPWHYRWIGREAAAAHRSSGLELRPFLERHVDG